MSEALLHNPLNNREQLGSLSLSVFLIKCIVNKFFTMHLRVLFGAARSDAFRGVLERLLFKWYPCPAFTVYLRIRQVFKF